MSHETLRRAGALILDDAGRIFIQRRSGARRHFPGCWEIVAGALLPGETYDDTLRREVTAETGWRVSHVLAELPDIRHTDADGRQRRERGHLVRVDGDLARPRLDPTRHTAWRWLGPGELGAIDADGDPGDRLTHQIVAAGFAVSVEIGLDR